jgi:alpha-tubulin suppressor-like RCC1 family protein
MSARRFGAVALLLVITACSDPQSPRDAVPASGAMAGVQAAAAPLVFSQVTGGDGLSCGLTADSLAWCWGYNEFGQLGTGFTTGPETCAGAAGPFSCSQRPTAVAGGLRFRQLSAGAFHVCGVTGDYRAWCWGSGGLGDGGGTDRPVPVLVAGGHRFRTVSAGGGHTCGVSYPDGAAWCWGANESGELGDGTLLARATPVAVLGSHRVRQVSAGGNHSCGVTPPGEAYCWGWNQSGQLGDSTAPGRRTRPVRVAGPGGYRQIDAGSYHTCAVTVGGRAYCWGDGRYGQLGNNRQYLSFWPRAVAGNVAFGRVSAGVFFSCGEALDGRAYCWGSNSFGEIGDGSVTDRLRPTPVAGGQRVAQMDAGGWHVCARTGAGAASCWGDGFFGALGNGASSFGAIATRPVAVLGPS